MVWKTIFDEDYLSSKVICFFLSIGMFPLEFDEDDPLAGLLSDEEDDLASKPKPKKTSTPKNTRSSGISSQGVLLVIHYFTMYSEFQMVQYTVQHLASKKRSYSSVVSDTGGLEEKIQVFPTGVKPMTCWLFVQMIYH